MYDIENLYELFQKCGKVSIDTRKDVKGSIFFAISGENFDGNKFAAQALKKGALKAVVDNKEFVTEKNIYLVKNTIKALQNLAKKHLSQLNIPVIAITGTNGKTTTKELISAVLSSEKKVGFTQGNLNNHIGVPLTILSFNQDIELAVVEMGANHQGEIKELCDFVNPDLGLITNIGKAHLEGFGNLQGVINEKQELYKSIKKKNGIVFVNYDDDLLMTISEHIRRITYGKNGGFIRGHLIKSKTPYIIVSWQKDKDKKIINTNLYGLYNFYNVMAAVTVGNYFNISPENIIEAIENYIPTNNRSQLVRTEKNMLILDAYNANPDSMKIAIKSFNDGNFRNKFLILGDMYELGYFALKEHQNIVDFIAKEKFNHVILVGKNFCSVKKPVNFQCVKTNSDAAKIIKTQHIKDFTILIKGSRAMQMEQLTKYL